MTDFAAMPGASSGQTCSVPPEDGTEQATSREPEIEGAKDAPLPPSDADIVRLRELLFSREIALIDDLRAALESRQFAARKVSEVLAEAVLLRSEKDPGLSMALEPVVDAIVKTSLNTRRNDLVNALFPLMGPTIHRSIAESFRSMLGSFSKSLEMSFSWKGLR